MNFFESLSNFGFSNLNNIDIIKVEEKKKSTSSNTEKKKFNESDYIFEKKYKCTCCGKEILVKSVKSGRVHSSHSDLDLRKKYTGVDLYKYEIIFCPNCGYASLPGSFTALSDKQIKAIQTKISSKFKCNPQLLNKNVYDYKDAIMLHELALLNSIEKNGRNSEKANLCLKLSWLFRGAIEALDEKKDEKLIKQYHDKEQQFLKVTYKGFMVAREKESFPIAGMNENTLDYLIAALGYEIGETDACLKLLGGVLTNRTATRNIKNKALELKEIIVKEKNKPKPDKSHKTDACEKG